MKLAYFDCFAGASGDMIIGALVDAGLRLDELRAELAKLKVAGFELTATKVVKNGISGTKVSVVTEEQQAHRHLRDIEQLIDRSDLSTEIKDSSKRVFRTLAVAEAKVHDTTPEKIHFHEVGALDAIVDIVGSVVGLSLLGVDKVTASPIHVGTGFVECQHGTIPLPAPATVEILKGAPFYSTGIETELCTPTGAAIIRTLAESIGAMPSMTVDSIGYGAGCRDLEIPNLLRLIIGRTEDDDRQTDYVTLIETNLDDMTPEHLGYAVERLMEGGALDVWLTPIQMKKGRPGNLLSVLASEAAAGPLVQMVLAETTTLGVRLQRIERRKLQREVRTISTVYGEVRVKMAMSGGKITHIAPEYDDCREIACREGIPLVQVYDQVRRAAQAQIL